MGPGPDRREAPDNGPWAAAQCRAAEPLIGGSNLSAARGREPHAWARVGWPEKETEWPSSDEQYSFDFI
jgi:hypothetical protein